jgi:hypothetical protein
MFLQLCFRRFVSSWLVLPDVSKYRNDSKSEPYGWKDNIKIDLQALCKMYRIDYSAPDYKWKTLLNAVMKFRFS